MSNFFNFLVAMWLPLLIAGLIGLFLGWLFFRGRKVEGDLSVEGEGALRSEADALRARVQELEGRVSTRDTEISDLKGKLTAGAVGAAAAGAAASAIAATGAKSDDEGDDTYALEWRNRYLAARVKYLEGQISETSAAAPKAVAKKAVAKKTTTKKASAKKSATKAVAGAATLAAAGAATKSASAPKKKAAPKKASKPKVLYTDGPTDGAPDDLKKIKGIGPKFEKDLNGKGIYYFRQIASWKKKDVKMVEGIIDSIPGRIERDDWVKQAGGLSKISTGRKKPGPKPGTKRGALTAAGKPRQKPGPKKGSTRGSSKKMSEADAAFEKYYTNVKKYDPKARKPVVQGIVKHCGIALSTRDGRLVACSDESELQTVADGFVTKKLGKTEGQMDLVKDICQQMKGERFKQRVTFYYLAAKKARKLGQFT